MHYYLHHGSPKADTYLYDMKRYHNYHHFSHHDNGNYLIKSIFKSFNQYQKFFQILLKTNLLITKIIVL